jgi:signal transduction histidine kinase
VYPEEAFFEDNRTSNPTFAGIGAAVIVLATALLFFLYDHFVHREFGAKRQLLQAKRDFMRFVSHEVRTPLNAVCMGLTLMRDEMGELLQHESESDATSENDENDTTTENPEVRRLQGWSALTKDVLTNTHSAVAVLNDLLNYDKIESGTLALELTVFSMWHLVQGTANEFKLSAQQKKIDFVVDFDLLQEESVDGMDSASSDSALILSRDMEDRRVVGDKIRIAQVLRNLLSNALKFSREEGKTGKVLSCGKRGLATSLTSRLLGIQNPGHMTIRTSWLEPSSSKLRDRKTATQFVLKNEKEVTFEKTGSVQVEVIDTGAGMSQEQLARLFRDGIQFNVNDLQAGNGSGLGLYISKGLAEQHGGTLDVSSKGLGFGTTFTLTLPLYYVPNSAEQVMAIEEATQKSPPKLCRRSWLLRSGFWWSMMFPRIASFSPVCAPNTAIPSPRRRMVKKRSTRSPSPWNVVVLSLIRFSWTMKCRSRMDPRQPGRFVPWAVTPLLWALQATCLPKMSISSSLVGRMPSYRNPSTLRSLHNSGWNTKCPARIWTTVWLDAKMGLSSGFWHGADPCLVQAETK